jgi:hypothetical protein
MLICRDFRTSVNNHDIKNPPLHGGGQGFESPRLHFYKFVWLIDLWGDDALIEEARRDAVDEIQ